LSVTKGLPPKLAWFDAHLGLSARAMGPVALACPALLTYATVSLDAKVPRPTMLYQTYSQTLGDVCVPGVTSSVLRNPHACRQVDFLTRAANLTQRQVGQLLTKHPGLLAASLEANLKPTVRQRLEA
jgi:hypothetical protein